MEVRAELGEARQDPRPVVTRLDELVHRLDPTRPTAQANLGQVTVDDPIIAMADLNAMNLYHGWYYGEATDVGPDLDAKAPVPDDGTAVGAALGLELPRVAGARPQNFCTFCGNS